MAKKIIRRQIAIDFGTPQERQSFDSKCEKVRELLRGTRIRRISNAEMVAVLVEQAAAKGK